MSGATKAAKPMGTFTVPAKATPRGPGELPRLNVYGTFGALLVTRNETLDAKEPYNITHEASGFKFGFFSSVADARKAAKELSTLDCWDAIAANPYDAPKHKEKVIPIVQRYGALSYQGLRAKR